MTPGTVRRAFAEACVLDVTSLKPGNVGIHGDGHRMVVADFLQSARAAAAPLTAPGLPVGERILGAVRATREAVGKNTNLGIVLLAAPLVQAALAPGNAGDPDALRARVAGVLAALTRADAARAFEAIVLAAPAGLGDAPRNDVRRTATVTLLEAMRDAAGHDLVAAQYANAYDDIFGTGLAAFGAARTAGAGWPDAATAVFLAFLARYPDSHVGRKLGRSQALDLRDEAVGRLRTRAEMPPPGAPQDDLLTWDRSLKVRGINPGTSADLTVATLLVALLKQASSQPASDP